MYDVSVSQDNRRECCIKQTFNYTPYVYRNRCVEVVNVKRLNLLQLAPGGHLGRFVIWTEGAFAVLDEIFGTFDKASTQKKDY